MPPKTKESLPKKSIEVLKEGDKWFKIYRYPLKQVHNNRVYWLMNTKKVEVKDPYRKRGKLKMDKTRVTELMNAMTTDQHKKILEFARTLTAQ